MRVNYQLRNRRAESFEVLQETGGVECYMPVTIPKPACAEATEWGAGPTVTEASNVLALHEFEGLEYKEIAGRMGCSIGTVMSRFYARRRMASPPAGLKREKEE